MVYKRQTLIAGLLQDTKSSARSPVCPPPDPHPDFMPFYVNGRKSQDTLQPCIPMLTYHMAPDLLCVYWIKFNIIQQYATSKHKTEIM